MDLIFSREVVSSHLTTMLTTIFHDCACWLWAVSQVNYEHKIYIFLLFVTSGLCENNWYLAFRFWSLFCSIFISSCGCSSSLPCRVWRTQSKNCNNSLLECTFLYVYFRSSLGLFKEEWIQWNQAGNLDAHHFVKQIKRLLETNIIFTIDTVLSTKCIRNATVAIPRSLKFPCKNDL